jgi:hypothetical protein
MGKGWGYYLLPNTYFYQMKKGPRLFFVLKCLRNKKKRCAIHFCGEWDEPEASAALFLAVKRCLSGQAASDPDDAF